MRCSAGETDLLPRVRIPKRDLRARALWLHHRAQRQLSRRVLLPLALLLGLGMLFGICGAGWDLWLLVSRPALPVLATVSLGDPSSGVAVDPALHRVYVATTTGRVWVLDAGTLTPVTTIQVGAFPTSVAVNPATHRVYVANAADGWTLLRRINRCAEKRRPRTDASITRLRSTGAPTSPSWRSRPAVAARSRFCVVRYIPAATLELQRGD